MRAALGVDSILVDPLIASGATGSFQFRWLEMPRASTGCRQSNLEGRPTAGRAKAANACADALTGLGDDGEAESAAGTLAPRASPESFEAMRADRFRDPRAMMHDSDGSIGR